MLKKFTCNELGSYLSNLLRSPSKLFPHSNQVHISVNLSTLLFISWILNYFKTSHIDMMVNPMTHDDSAYLSMRLSRISVEMALGVLSPSLNTLSMTDSSVLVVSRPQKAIQSLTVIPAPITSLPLFTVPAYRK